MPRGEGWPSKIPHTTVPELILSFWLYSILVESITFHSPKGTYVIGDSSSSAGPPLALGQSWLCSLAPICAGLISHHLHTSALYLHLTHMWHPENPAAQTSPPFIKISMLFPSEILCNLTGPASVFISGDSFPHPSNNGHFVIFKHTILSTECKLCQSLIYKLWNTLNIKRRFLLSHNSHFSRKSQRINKIISYGNKVLWRQWWGVCVCVRGEMRVSYFKYSAQG